MPDTKAQGTVWDVPAGKLAAASTGLWNELGEQGAGIIMRLKDDELFRQRVASHMLDGAWQPLSSSQLVAAVVIMGRENVWLPTDWCRYFGFRLPEDELMRAAEIPFSPETLDMAKEDFFLFYALPRTPDEKKVITIRYWPALCRHNGNHVWLGPWVDGLTLRSLGEEVLSGWQLVRKNVIRGSSLKSYTEQVAMLPEHWQVPSAIQEVMKSSLMFIKTGILANKASCSRTSSFINTMGPDKPDRCLTVGSCGIDGKVRQGSVGITVYWSHLEQEEYMRGPGSIDYSRKRYVGMGAAWKPGM